MVHQYQLNGYNIVLDTCSNAIHVVDEVAYDVISRSGRRMRSFRSFWQSMPDVRT